MPPRALYVTPTDPLDPDARSGVPYSIGRCVAPHGIELDPLAIPPTLRSWCARVVARARRDAGLSTFEPYRTITSADHAASVIEKRLRVADAELVFSCDSISVARLRGTRPLAFWVDATFAGMLGYYPGSDRLSRRAQRVGHELEAAALERASIAIYVSEWAAASAVDAYGVDPAKIAVVPRGPNLPVKHNEDDVRDWIAARRRERIRLLFVGTDWERKGGDVAVEAARVLTRQGHDLEFVVVGATPRLDAEASAFTRIVGRLSKARPGEVGQLSELFTGADFLILPTRAECMGIVFAEASAFGVPSLACETGGVASAVVHERNGLLFKPGSAPEEFAEAITRVWADEGAYAQLALGAWREHVERLNWDVSGKKVADLLRTLAR